MSLIILNDHLALGYLLIVERSNELACPTDSHQAGRVKIYDVWKGLVLVSFLTYERISIELLRDDWLARIWVSRDVRGIWLFRVPIDHSDVELFIVGIRSPILDL